MSRLKVGDSVHYHPIIGEDHDGKIYEIRDLGDLPGDRPVAWLKGKAGCVALDALSRAREDQRPTPGEPDTEESATPSGRSPQGSEPGSAGCGPTGRQIDGRGAPSHTPEPWRVNDEHSARPEVEVVSVPRRCVTAWSEDYEDAARIVACVNACAGMEDPGAEIALLRGTVEAERQNRHLAHAQTTRQAEKIEALTAALQRLYRAYVSTLESGRLRILDLGGQCDPVDRMQSDDPNLREVRALLAEPGVTGRTS